MSDPEPQPAPPPHQPFQFGLRTLLLLFVVLGSSLAVFGGWGFVVFIAAFGFAICIRTASWLWLLALLAVTTGCVLCLQRPVAGSSHREDCHYRLFQIAGALAAYHGANGCYPPAYIADASGKPMHSWRTLLLRFFEDPLYKEYDFSESWDGPKNKRLLAKRPKVYSCPDDPTASAAGAVETSYLAVVGPNCAFSGAKSKRVSDLTTVSLSNTIMVIEVSNSGIPWSEPRDLPLEATGVLDPRSPDLALKSSHTRHKEFFFTYEYGSGVHVAMADGRVEFLRTEGLSSEELRQKIETGSFNESDFGYYDYDSAKPIPNWPNIAALAVWLLSVGALLTLAVRSRKGPPAQKANDGYCAATTEIV